MSGWFEVPVRGGSLGVARWGEAGPVVLAAHGITASHRAWAAVAESLGGGASLVAPDLRGRGASAELGPPYGMAAHADDLAAVLHHLGATGATVVGHSMGGWVATQVAARHPQLVERVVLIDGGLSLALPPGIDPDSALEAVLGPALARLSMTFPSRDAYRDFWRAHPAFAGPGTWDEHVEAYVDYDLAGEEPELRSRVSEEAVRADGADLIRNQEVVAALGRLTCPVHLLRSPRGLMDEPNPLLGDEVVAEGCRLNPALTHEVVPDTNHYTILFREPGPSTVAKRLLETS